MIPQVVVAFLNLWLWAVGRSGWLKHHGEPPGDIGLVAVYEQTLYYVYENNLGFSALQIPEKSNIHRSGGNFCFKETWVCFQDDLSSELWRDQRTHLP